MIYAPLFQSEVAFNFRLKAFAYLLGAMHRENALLASERDFQVRTFALQEGCALQLKPLFKLF
jgi:hypothetical protein